MTPIISEDQVRVLNAVRDDSLDAIAAEMQEAIAECLAEGLIDQKREGKFSITSTGSARLLDVDERLFKLTQLTVHEPARVAFVSQRIYDRFQRLRALGLAPGVMVSVCQRIPSYVVRCEETEIAIEEDIARDIFVWRLHPQAT